jgi:DNA-binding MarR family transcriptional regulator
MRGVQRLEERTEVDGATHPFLASYLPYLLNRVTREMLRGVDEQFAQHNLNVNTWRILAVLSDQGTCRFGELAGLTAIEPATLSRFVTNLEATGLVRRRRPKADARTVEISLTDQGAKSFTGTLPWAHDVEQRLTTKLSAADVKHLKRMLAQMFSNLKGAGLPDLNAKYSKPRRVASPRATKKS